MKEKDSLESEGAAAPDEGEDARAPRMPARERRSASRVADDQGSGHGAMSALSKLKMLERQRRLVRSPRDGEQEGGPSAV